MLHSNERVHKHQCLPFTESPHRTHFFGSALLEGNKTFGHYVIDTDFAPRHAKLHALSDASSIHQAFRHTATMVSQREVSDSLKVDPPIRFEFGHRSVWIGHPGVRVRIERATRHSGHFVFNQVSHHKFPLACPDTAVRVSASSNAHAFHARPSNHGFPGVDLLAPRTLDVTRQTGSGLDNRGKTELGGSAHQYMAVE